MNPPLMRLKVVLPSQVFTIVEAVRRIVAETREGSFGLWPRRLDCVAALSPGILTCDSAGGGETYLAIDEGVLVKTGPDVLVSVRHAVGGADLGQLRAAVERDFLSLHERERSVRSVLARMESGLIRRLMELNHG